MVSPHQVNRGQVSFDLGRSRTAFDNFYSCEGQNPQSHVHVRSWSVGDVTSFSGRSIMTLKNFYVTVVLLWVQRSKHHLLLVQSRYENTILISFPVKTEKRLIERREP